MAFLMAAGTAPWAALRTSFQGGSFKVSSSSSSSQHPAIAAILLILAILMKSQSTFTLHFPNC